MSSSKVENTLSSIEPNSNPKPLSHISLAAFSQKTISGKVFNFFAPILDRLLGIKKLNNLYIEQQFSGLDKQDFSEKLLDALGVSILSVDKVLNKIPKTGKCIVVCNHPYGMVEGVIIAHLLTNYRKDTKVMANIGLKVFKEINDYFIFANPLKPKAVINSTAIKQCYRHVENDGLLVIFPAGRVSFYQSEQKVITDGHWNRLAVNIADKTQSPILPIFISGTNSALFHRLGRVYYRFRLLMLAREMFKLQNHQITLSANNLITPKQLAPFSNSEMKNNLLRLQCYLNDQQYFQPWLQDEAKTLISPVAEKTDSALIKSELEKLPAKQHLLAFKHYAVYYGYQTQIPNCVKEIARLRELTFRDLDEGSGEPYDTDKFDATYMHLFIYDHNNNQITGAYRIGQTDRLQKQGGLAQLYLSQMFNFNDDFINQQQPCLEMGRSFIIASEQKSYHSLLLLWKGIGAYVSQNPRYRTFYGTVSLSKLYDPRSVAIMEKIMVNASAGVTAKTAFSGQLHPEVTQFMEQNTLGLEGLSTIISAIEEDGKDIPVLLKQYHKLGANFHCMAIDTNFNQTPGLLLSVHFPSAPKKLLKLYLGNNKADYLAYKE
ncbi:lysophospholipid acyltransferase family protein [Candidatus Colwellia aromaticivorans]|uniref:lysophospholipid acyltransferase family protein n=1 Tax=Candidatus Colwellia aromaticivorans TaxID=2267621 RepID=UPI000DF49A6C|nr:GNAT family N-acyltransferase [Candidatus Colwellia aromaticivorans]